MCCGYGMVVSIGVLLYAISMRGNNSRYCLMRLVNTFFEQFGYVTLYLLVDIFVPFGCSPSTSTKMSCMRSE